MLHSPPDVINHWDISERIIYEGGRSRDGDVVQLGPTDRVIGRRDRLQGAAKGFSEMQESAVFALVWVLVAAVVIVPWGLLFWWLLRTFVGM